MGFVVWCLEKEPRYRPYSLTIAQHQEFQYWEIKMVWHKSVKWLQGQIYQKRLEGYHFVSGTQAALGLKIWTRFLDKFMTESFHYDKASSGPMRESRANRWLKGPHEVEGLQAFWFLLNGFDCYFPLMECRRCFRGKKKATLSYKGMYQIRIQYSITRQSVERTFQKLKFIVSSSSPD